MVRTCVIMQPTYLPWAGYFNLILNADIFVFLDDVQFEKQSWQNRNKIIIDSKEHLLSIPVKRNGLKTAIKDVLVDDTQKWRKKHISAISQNYCGHKYYKNVKIVLDIINDSTLIHLVDINMSIIQSLCDILSIKKEFIRSSELACAGTRSEKLVNVINHLNCNRYLSPIGSKTYIENDVLLSDNDIDIGYQNFKLKDYKQKNMESFISYLSIIDVIANLGILGTQLYISD